MKSKLACVDDSKYIQVEHKIIKIAKSEKRLEFVRQILKKRKHFDHCQYMDTNCPERKKKNLIDDAKTPSNGAFYTFIWCTERWLAERRSMSVAIVQNPDWVSECGHLCEGSAR